MRSTFPGRIKEHEAIFVPAHSKGCFDARAFVPWKELTHVLEQETDSGIP
jgi:hypothetical protein